MSFQKYFRNLREKERKTQKQFAKDLGISLATIKKIEGGYTSMPSLKLISALSDYLQIHRSFLMREILFYEYDKDYSISIPWFLQNFLSSMYLAGWNIEIEPTYHHKFLGSCNYPAFLYKNGTYETVLVDTLGHHKAYLQLQYTKESIEEYLTKWLLDIIQLEDLPNVKQIIIVFDYTKEIDKKLFKLIESLPTKFIRLEVCAILYEYGSEEIVERKVFNRSNAIFTKTIEQL